MRAPMTLTTTSKLSAASTASQADEHTLARHQHCFVYLQTRQPRGAVCSAFAWQSARYLFYERRGTIPMGGHPQLGFGTYRALGAGNHHLPAHSTRPRSMPGLGQTAR